MAKPKNIVRYWSPFIVRHVGFDVPLPLESCINRLDKYLPHDPKESHWRLFQRFAIEWGEKSNQQWTFRIEYRIRSRPYYRVLATCNGTLKKSDASLTSVDTEIKVYWQSLVVIFSLATLGLGTLISYGYGNTCIPIPIALFIWCIFSWRQSIKARESLVAFIQGELQ